MKTLRKVLSTTLAFVMAFSTGFNNATITNLYAEEIIEEQQEPEQEQQQEEVVVEETQPEEIVEEEIPEDVVEEEANTDEEIEEETEEEEATETKFVYEDSKFIVTATTSEELPETTSFVVRELVKGESAYSQAENAVENYATQNDVTYGGYVFYDMHFEDKDGVEFEPGCSVTVKVDYKRAEKIAENISEEDIEVLHILDGTQQVENLTNTGSVDLNTNGAVEEATFVTDSFSTIVIASRETDTVKVKVKCDDDRKFWIRAEKQSQWGPAQVGQTSVEVQGGEGEATMEISNWDADPIELNFKVGAAEHGKFADDDEAFIYEDTYYTFTEEQDDATKTVTLTLTGKEIKPGATTNPVSALGNAAYYGVVVNTLNLNGHIDSNIAVGNLAGSFADGITVGQHTGNNNPGNSIIAEITQKPGFFIYHGSKKPFIISTTPEAEAKIQKGDRSYVLYDTNHTAAELKGVVSGMVNGTASSTLMGQDSYSLKALVDNQTKLDLTSYPDGTYYIDVDDLSLIGEAGKLKININGGQNVVFNIPNGGDVNIQKFQITVDGATDFSDTNTKEADPFLQHVIWNVPNASSVTLNGVYGAFLAPNAHVHVGGTSSGWVVANAFTNQGEWHNVWVDQPESFITKAAFNAKKVLEGANIADYDGKFTFFLKDASGKTLQTKTNDALGNVKFDEMEFGKAGTFEYYISEEKGNLPNVTYDETPVKVTVVVGVMESTSGDKFYTIESITYAKQDQKTRMVVEGDSKFVNKYEEKQEKGSLLIKKNVTAFGKSENVGTKADGTYTFEISKENDATFAPVEMTITIKNGVSNTAQKDELEPGTYIVKETKSSNKNVTLDKEAKTFVVEAGKTTDLTPVQFTNDYTAKEVKTHFEAKKELTGRTLVNNEFQFTLSDATGELESVSNNGQNVVFSDITYKQVGTYNYTIQEKAGDLKGVTYDTTTYKAVVKVTDDGSGQLKADVKYYDAKGNEVAATNVVFKNTYKAGKTSVQFKATKVLNGRTLKDDEFTFKLTGEGLNYTVKNKGQQVTFPEISYEKAGTYNYTMEEVAGNEKGVTYSNVKYDIVVEVKDNDKGELVASKKYFKDGKEVAETNIEFVNTYKTSIKINKTDITGLKELYGAVLELYDANNKQVGKSWTSEQGKVWEQEVVPGTYTMKETVAPKGYDLTADFTFEVDENGKVTLTDVGNPNAAVDADGVLLVKDDRINKGTYFIDITKVIDAEGYQLETAKSFKFNIIDKETNGKAFDEDVIVVVDPEEDPNEAKERVFVDLGTYIITETSYDNIDNFEFVGTSYDVNGKATKEVEVTKETSGIGVQFKATNKYTHEKGGLTVKKNITGDLTDKDLTDAQKASMKFTVTGPNGYKAEKTYAEFTDGQWTLTNLPIGTYKVVETGGEVKDYELKVEYSVNADKAEVTKAGKTSVEVTNTYKRDKGELTVKKNITGDLTDKDLTREQKASMKFTVTGPEGYKAEKTYAEFTDGQWTLTNLPTGTYKVVETGGEVKDYELKVEYSVNADKAVVTKAGKTSVEVTNTYKREKGTLIIKKLIAGDLADKDLTREQKASMKFTVTGPEEFKAEKTYAEFVQGAWNLGEVPTGKYTVVETGGEIEKYELKVEFSVKDGNVEIKKGDETTVEITNTYNRDKGNLVVKKLITGFLSDKDLKESDKEDMVFTVYGNGFREEKTYAEFEDGEWLIENLPTGEYTVVEEVANKTGLKLKTTYSVEGGKTEVKKNETAEVTITNDYTNTIVEKVDGTDKSLIKGATMQVLDGKKVIDEWITDGTLHQIKVLLEPGKVYTLHEKKAPKGYKLAKDTKFVINADGTIDTTKTTSRVKDGYLVVEDARLKPGTHTGLNTNSTFYVGGMFASMLGALAILLKRRQEQE